jgi:hypothetical protein
MQFILIVALTCIVVNTVAFNCFLFVFDDNNHFDEYLSHFPTLILAKMYHPSINGKWKGGAKGESTFKEYFLAQTFHILTQRKIPFKRGYNTNLF